MPIISDRGLRGAHPKALNQTSLEHRRERNNRAELPLCDMGFAGPLELGLSAQGQEGWGQGQRKRPLGVAGLRKCEIPIVY